MSAASIRAKVKNGLAKASSATGSTNSEPVYLVKSTTVGGSPLSAGVTTTTSALLPNAIFKSYDAKMLNSTILAGDRMLICDNVTPIKQGDTVKQGASFYIIVSVDIKAPKSDVLAYIAQARLK
jgi:hypothetical protein